MSDIIYIKPDKTKTYTVNSEEEYNYYKSLKPSSKWDRIHFKYKCSKCNEIHDTLLLNLNFPFICRNCRCKISASKETTKQKRKATCLEKYGVENTFQSEEKKEKIKQTCLERYGYDNCAKNPDIYDKVKQTNLERYGFVCSLNTAENLAKRKETWLKNLGVDNPNKSIDIREKAIKNNIKKYGVKYYSQTDEYKIRSFKTKLEKYGDPFYSGNILYEYDSIFFRSKPELCFYIYHKDNNIPIIYEPMPYFEYECHNEKHFYKPDFLVEDKLYEIKGDKFFNENGILIDPYNRNNDDLAAAKQECMIKNNVIILKSEQYNFYINYVKDKYGRTYTEQFKYKKEE